MAIRRRPNRKGRISGSLHETGLRLVFLGLAFLIAPKLFGGSAMMKVVSAGLSLPGWLLLGAGVLLLGIVFIRNKSMRAVSGLQQNAEPFIVNGSARLPPRRLTEWSPTVFAVIEWRRFEAVCEALFAQDGFDTRSQSHGADGGVDIWLYPRNGNGAATIVQCKHRRSTLVNVKEMREFYGVMASHQLKRGTYATSSTYTADAQKFAKYNGINAMDGAKLLQLIATRTPEQQQALRAVAFEGDYWRPTCASCGTKMVERKPGKGGAAFWGCSSYPRCTARLGMTTPLS